MEDLRKIIFTDSAPMKRECGLPRKLDTSSPDRWVFKGKVPLIVWFMVLFCFLPVEILFLVAAKGQAAPLIFIAVFNAILLFALFFHLKEFFKTPVFDFEMRCFYRGRRKSEYGDVTALEDYLPLSQISALQLLSKVICGRKGNTWQAWELNIITQDLTRRFVTDSRNEKELKKEAELLAEKLNVPLKIKDEAKIEKKKMPLFAALLFFLIFGGSGFAALYFTAIEPVRLFHASKTWHETQAVVTQSDFRSERRSKGGKGGGSYTVYIADITYTYKYKGKDHYSSRRTFFKQEFSHPAGAKEELRKYPRGKKISCFVDPAKPDQAVLLRQFDLWYVVKGALFSLVFIGVGVSFLLVKLLRSRK